MGEIKTASLRELATLPKDSYRVIIMRFFPWWMKDIKKKYNLYAPELAPSKELLKETFDAVKKYGPKTAWGLARFEPRFRHELLNRSKALDTMRKLKRIAKELDVYLICKEASDEFCHRRIVREIMINFALGD